MCKWSIFKTDLTPNMGSYSFLKRIILLINITGSIFLVQSCKDQPLKDELAIDADTATFNGTTQVQLSAQNVFNSMPGKQVVAELIASNQIEYNIDFVNDPLRLNNYTTENKKALNLGIYGTDLIIASTFDQTQESMAYLKCVNGLAGSLGVSAAFDQTMMDRMEANKENRDSTLEIVANAFKKADNWLNANNRPATSALIVSGTWIEALYVACCYSVGNDKLTESVLKQRESLTNLITLLTTTDQNEDVKEIRLALEALKADFDKANGEGVNKKDIIGAVNAKVKVLRDKCVK